MVTVTPPSLQSAELHRFFDTHAPGRQAGQLQAYTRAKAELTLVTAEGDKVSLGARSAFGATYTTYNAQGRLQGPASVHAEALQVNTQKQFSVAVQGDLNAAELADIERLLSRLGKIATDFFSGNLDPALFGALDIGELDSIAGFTAGLEFTQRLSLTQIATTQQTTDNTTRVPPEAETTAASPTAPPGVNSVIDEMIRAVHDARPAIDTLADRLPGFVSELFKKLADDLDLDTARRQLAAHITSTLSQRLKLTAAISEADAAASTPTQEGKAEPSHEVETPAAAESAAPAIPADGQSNASPPPEVPPDSDADAAVSTPTQEGKAEPSHEVETPATENSHPALTAEFKADFSQRFRFTGMFHHGHEAAVRYQVEGFLATTRMHQLNVA